MIGYFTADKPKLTARDLGKVGTVLIYPATYVGGCCMGINGFLPPAMNEIRLLIPYNSIDSGKEITLTLDEIKGWLAFINEIGFECTITNEELITYTDTRNSGIYCEIAFVRPAKCKFSKYNLVVLTLVRYMFNRSFRYREVYENTIKLNKLIPDVDPIVRLHLAHRLVMTDTINHNSSRNLVDAYSGYYGLFKHEFNVAFLTSNTLNARINNDWNSINDLFSTRITGDKDLNPITLLSLVNKPTEEHLIKLKEIINRNLQ
jgi:hypothetical protein